MHPQQLEQGNIPGVPKIWASNIHFQGDKPRVKHGELRGRNPVHLEQHFKKIPAKEKMKKMLFPLKWSTALCNRRGGGENQTQSEPEIQFINTGEGQLPPHQ